MPWLGDNNDVRTYFEEDERRFQAIAIYRATLDFAGSGGYDGLGPYRCGRGKSFRTRCFRIKEAGPAATCPGTPAQCFADVLPSNPFYAFINRIYEQDLVTGYPCGGTGEPCDADNRPYYRPANSVTRGQMAKFIDNARHLPQIDIEAASSTALIVVSNTTGIGVHGSSPNNWGVAGDSTNGYGVRGNSPNGVGVVGNSTDGTGVIGTSTNSYGVYGEGAGDGVKGHSNGFGVEGESTGAAGIYSAGVYGSSENAKGVWGISTNGVGIYGYSTNSDAGFSGGTSP